MSRGMSRSPGRKGTARRSAAAGTTAVPRWKLTWVTALRGLAALAVGVRFFCWEPRKT